MVDSAPPLSQVDKLVVCPKSDALMGFGPDSEMQEIFKVAQHFSSQDRADAIAERKRCQLLLDFISANGHSLQEVNVFASKGALPRKVIADKVFDKNSLRAGNNLHDGLEEGEISGSESVGLALQRPSSDTPSSVNYGSGIIAADNGTAPSGATDPSISPANDTKLSTSAKAVEKPPPPPAALVQPSFGGGGEIGLGKTLLLVIWLNPNAISRTTHPL